MVATCHKASWIYTNHVWYSNPHTVTREEMTSFPAHRVHCAMKFHTLLRQPFSFMPPATFHKCLSNFSLHVRSVPFQWVRKPVLSPHHPSLPSQTLQWSSGYLASCQVQGGEFSEEYSQCELMVSESIETRKRAESGGEVQVEKEVSAAEDHLGWRGNGVQLQGVESEVPEEVLQGH